MSKVHRRTLEALELKAEGRHGRVECVLPCGHNVPVPAHTLLALCADSERLSQIERWIRAIEFVDTDVLRNGIATMALEAPELHPDEGKYDDGRA